MNVYFCFLRAQSLRCPTSDYEFTIVGDGDSSGGPSNAAVHVLPSTLPCHLERCRQVRLLQLRERGRREHGAVSPLRVRDKQRSPTKHTATRPSDRQHTVHLSLGEH